MQRKIYRRNGVSSEKGNKHLQAVNMRAAISPIGSFLRSLFN